MGKIHQSGGRGFYHGKSFRNKRNRRSIRFHNESAASQNNDVSDSPPFSQNEDAINNIPDIPGFFYDSNKKRYFRILPEHSNPQMAVINDQRRKAAKLQTSSELRETEGLSKITAHRQIGLYSHLKSLRLLTENIVGRMHLNYKCKVACALKDNSELTLMRCNPNNRSILCLWRRPQIFCQIDLDEVSRNSNALCNPSISIPRAHQNQVSDVCFAGESKIVYTTYPLQSGCCCVHIAMSHAGDVSSFARFNICEHMLWACAWDEFTDHIAVGSEKSCLFMDPVSGNVDWLSSGRSDVHALAFFGPHRLLGGTQSGATFCWDLRLRNSEAVGLFRLKSRVSSLCPMRDSNYVIASDLSGLVSCWDLRLRKCVKEFVGNSQPVGSRRLPVIVDEQLGLIVAADAARLVHIWDLRSSDVIKSFALPTDTSSSVPVVWLSDFSSSKSSSPTLIAGVKDELVMFTI